MAITPDTDIYLIKCPLELSSEHQMRFDNANAQADYFLNLPHIKVDSCTYQRHNNVIRFPANIDTILEYNYVVYRNNNYGNKWFYAFITNMEWASSDTTFITIKTDVWQTWQFNLNFKNSFVERECVSNDTVGAHTVPEGLDLGEFMTVDQRYTSLSDTWVWCFQVTKLPKHIDGTEITIKGSDKQIGKVFNSLITFAAIGLDEARNVVKLFEQRKDLTSDAIVNIYPIPSYCLKLDWIGQPTTYETIFDGETEKTTINMYPIASMKIDDNNGANYSIQQPNKLAGGYAPRNNKLFTFPFSYFYASNGTGEDVVYHWEDFTTQAGQGTTGKTAIYNKAIVPSSGVSAKVYFLNYKGIVNTNKSSYTEVAYNNGVNFSKAPVCAWTTDYYTNWLTQNGINVALNVAGGIGGMIGGIATKNATAAVGSAGAIVHTLAEMRKASTTPNQAHGDTNTGDVMFSLTNNIIKFYMMSVRPEVARIIDNYFTMYGYKVSTLKAIELHSRRYWNYIKTIGILIEAEIPQTDLDEIKGLFNNGITLWHSPDAFMNYNLSNTIL